MREIIPRIVVDPRIRFGKPVIKGTRVPVDLIVGKIAGGMTVTEVVKEYKLKEGDVLAIKNEFAMWEKLSDEAWSQIKD